MPDNPPAEAPPENIPDGTVRLAAPNLRMALAAVVPFAGTTFAAVNRSGVHIEAGNGRLAATATNGIFLGRALRPATGTLPCLVIPRPAVELLLALTDPDAAAWGDDVTLTVDEQALKLTVTMERFKTSVPITIRPQTGISQFRAVLDPAGYSATGADAAAYSVHAFKLVRDALEGAELTHHPVRMYYRDRLSPLRLEVMDWFVALIMPIRLSNDDPGIDAPIVPADLPAEPADSVAEPVTTHWPDTESAATATRLWACFAHNAILTQRHMFDGPAIALPPAAEQTAEQKRIADANYYEIMTVAHLVSLARVLRDFHLAAPAAADACAREIWSDINDGDDLTEWPWEWLRQLGVALTGDEPTRPSPERLEAFVRSVAERVTSNYPDRREGSHHA